MVSLLLPIIYIAFISLGLPDSLLGSAWPTMYPELGVPVSCAGILSMIISLGTILSSLQSDRLTRTLGMRLYTSFRFAAFWALFSAPQTRPGLPQLTKEQIFFLFIIPLLSLLCYNNFIML